MPSTPSFYLSFPQRQAYPVAPITFFALRRQQIPYLFEKPRLPTQFLRVTKTIIKNEGWCRSRFDRRA